MSRYSLAGCTVALRTAGSEKLVEACVAGDLDRDAIPMLTEVTNYLAGLSAELIVMDLRHLGFAGSALPNWIYRMRYRLGDRTPVVVVRHPQPLVRWVLAATDMVDLIDDRRPGDVTADFASRQRRLRPM